jgi:two-component system KDP operon response regulator KdpE
MADVLIIEDDARIRKFLRLSLEANDFTVHEARLGQDGIDVCAHVRPDVVILDLGLPDMDGQEVIKRIREWSTVPIIVLSVRADEAEKVSALDAGAHDYVTKPFSITELMARLRVMLRSATTSRAEETTVYRHGELEVDLARRRIYRNGEEQHLSRKEYDLLRLLVTNAGQVLTHQQILARVWGPKHSEDTHYLRVLVKNLRQKLGDEPARPKFIHTVQGVGYRFSDS